MFSLLSCFCDADILLSCLNHHFVCTRDTRLNTSGDLRRPWSGGVRYTRGFIVIGYGKLLLLCAELRPFTLHGWVCQPPGE